MNTATLERLTNIIIGVVGCVLICIAIICKDNETIYTIIMSVGTSLLASAIVSYLISLYVFKRQKEKEVTDKWKLTSICETRAEMNLQIDKHLEKAEQHLDVISYGLKSLRETKTELLRQRISKGLKIRIITCNPDNSILKLKDADEQKIEGSTADSIKKLAEWCKDLGAEIKYIETLPTELFFRVDNVVYVGPYQLLKESQRTITFEFPANGDGFNYYCDYFERLWNSIK